MFPRLTCARAVGAVLSIALAAIAVPASAGTFLVNSDFDQDLSGWTPTGEGLVGWSTMDALDDEFSGSVQIVNASAGAFSRVRPLRQCVQIDFPGMIQLQASGRLAAGQTGAPLSFGYTQKVNPDCSGGHFAGGGRFITRNDGWEHVEFRFMIETVPAYIEVELALEKFAAGGSASGWLDNVYLDVAPLRFGDGFETP